VDGGPGSSPSPAESTPSSTQRRAGHGSALRFAPPRIDRSPVHLRTSSTKIADVAGRLEGLGASQGAVYYEELAQGDDRPADDRGDEPVTTSSSRPGGVRVGADLVRVDDVATCIARFGDRYVGRLFTEHEREACRGVPETRAAGLAARFAAKEAAIKVLRPEDQGLDWRAIEVHRHPRGWCELRLSGNAARLARQAGIREMAVSLSHEAGFAAAVVIALCDPPPETQADGR
jgi:holo-[acyl-carrier protein] synthase